jgi:YfiH family protein
MDFLPIDFWSGLSGAFFNRHGGVSPVPFDSLNVSYGVGDAADRVDRNRRLVQDRLGLSTLISARQVHGDRILMISNQLTSACEYDGYDALITNQHGVGLMIQQADCQAVVLYDPDNRVVANVHVGWRGSVAMIIIKIIQRLTAEFGTDPSRLRAAISPSLGPCCAEFVRFQAELPPEFHPYQARPAYFDFWAISRWQLQEAGVLPEHIRTAGICTRCDHSYFSYRREGITGRSATVVALC